MSASGGILYYGREGECLAVITNDGNNSVAQLCYKWNKIEAFEKSIRYDAKVYTSLNIQLPNSWSAEQAKKTITDFLQNSAIREQEYAAFIHEGKDGEVAQNFHFHLIYNERSKLTGKKDRTMSKIGFQRDLVRGFQQTYGQEVLRKIGKIPKVKRIDMALWKADPAEARRGKQALRALSITLQKEKEAPVSRAEQKFSRQNNLPEKPAIEISEDAHELPIQKTNNLSKPEPPFTAAEAKAMVIFDEKWSPNSSLQTLIRYFNADPENERNETKLIVVEDKHQIRVLQLETAHQKGNRQRIPLHEKYGIMLQYDTAAVERIASLTLSWHHEFCKRQDEVALHIGSRLHMIQEKAKKGIAMDFDLTELQAVSEKNGLALRYNGSAHEVVVFDKRIGVQAEKVTLALRLALELAERFKQAAVLYKVQSEQYDTVMGTSPKELPGGLFKGKERTAAIQFNTELAVRKKEAGLPSFGKIFNTAINNKKVQAFNEAVKKDFTITDDAVLEQVKSDIQTKIVFAGKVAVKTAKYRPQIQAAKDLDRAMRQSPDRSRSRGVRR